MNPTNIKELTDFSSNYPLRRYKQGHILVKPGDEIRCAHLLIEGKVKVYDVSYRGDEIIITNRIPPAVFPMSFVLNSAPSRYIYEASTDIVVHEIPTGDMRAFLDTHPKIVRELLSNLYAILDDVLERMVHYITSNAKHRLVYAIVSECKEFGTLLEDNTYRIDVNETELASRAGLTRETVSREARSLKRAHQLEIHRNFMIVHSLHELEEYVRHRS